jgi:isobutyryl-CoA mutase
MPCRATASEPGARWRSSSPRWKRQRRRRRSRRSLRSAAQGPDTRARHHRHRRRGQVSLTDELIRRLRLDQGDALRIAVISIDPSRRKSGGALLGDRIRMNAIGPGKRARASSCARLATRDFGSEISQALPDVLAACKVAGFDLIVVETSGIGQGDAAIVPLVDVPLYVMTPEFGAASQLEKIDMLDFAEFVAINKFDRKGAADALRDVAKQVQRNRRPGHAAEQMPVFGTMASRFNDDGVTALYQALLPRLAELGLPLQPRPLPLVATCATARTRRPSCRRARALPGRHRRHRARLQARARSRRAWRARSSSCAPAPHAAVDKPDAPARPKPRSTWPQQREARLDPPRASCWRMWPDMQKAYAGDEYVVKIRDKEIRTALTTPRSRAPRSARWRCRSTRTTARC